MVQYKERRKILRLSEGGLIGYFFSSGIIRLTINKGIFMIHLCISNIQYSLSQPNSHSSTAANPTDQDLWLVEMLVTWSQWSGVWTEKRYFFVIIICWFVGCWIHSWIVIVNSTWSWVMLNPEAERWTLKLSFNSRTEQTSCVIIIIIYPTY